MYLGAVREAMQVLERREEVSKLMNVQGKRNAAYACQLAMGAVSKLFNAAGGRALYTDSVLQRQFRVVRSVAGRTRSKQQRCDGVTAVRAIQQSCRSGGQSAVEIERWRIQVNRI